MFQDRDLKVTLGARLPRDSLWLEFSQPREGSNNSLTNGNSSGGRGRRRRRTRKSRSLTVQFFRAVTVCGLKELSHLKSSTKEASDIFINSIPGFKLDNPKLRQSNSKYIVNIFIFSPSTTHIDTYTHIQM